MTPGEIGAGDVNKAIRRVAWSALDSLGFTDRTSRTAWRRWDGGVDVVNFQSFNAYLADGIGSTTFSFNVNLGVRIGVVPPAPKADPYRPKEWQCELRRHLAKTLSQPFFEPYASVREHARADGRFGNVDRAPVDRPDVWFVKADGTNVDDCVADALGVIQREGLPWFESARDPDVVLQHLGDGDDYFAHMGRPGSPARTYVIAFVAAAAGKPSLAREHLTKLRDTAYYKYQAAAIDEALAALA